MDHTPHFEMSDIRTLILHIQSIFSNLNVGLLIYHLEDPEEASRLKLVYANEAASTYTGTDLQKRVGRYILDAFPALADTDIPQIYQRVVREKKARELGAVEYEDADMKKEYYAVKAFPMPYDCAGVVFENITLRKKVDDMVKHLNEQLKTKNQEQEGLIAAIVQTLKGPVQDIQTYIDALKAPADDEKHDDKQAILDNLIGAASRLSQTLDGLLQHSTGKD